MDDLIARWLDGFRTDGGLTVVDIADCLDVSTASVAQWLSGTSQPSALEGLILADLRQVIVRLRAFHGAPDVQAWLTTPNAELGGARPLDAVRDGHTMEVLGAVRRPATCAAS